MFNNPIFEYGGINNAGGADPYIVSLANTSSTASEVKLFNAQQNLTLENQGLPDGVVANAESIFEMPTAQTFSCYSFAPLIGFPAGTTFSLRLATSGLIPQFTLVQNLITFTNKTLVGAFSGIQNLDFVKPNRAQFRNLSATAEGDFQILRFVFSVTDLAVTKGQDIVAEIKSYLLSQVNEMMGGESTPKKPKIQVEDKEADVVVVFKTRKEWSVGQQGDPRRNKRRGRKGKKSLTKSQILSFMRKTYNGKFSSELISYKQYVAEFSREYKKAYNREWWRANLGKGLEHYDKNDYRAIVKK